MSKRALADVRQQLRQVAYELGYPQTTGTQARQPGHGSAGRLLIGMLTGEVLTVRLRPEQLAAAIHALNPVDEPWADAIVERLYDQLRRLRSLAP
jgi:hypothetical protein